MQTDIYQRTKCEHFRARLESPEDDDAVVVLERSTETTPRGVALRTVRLRFNGQCHTLGGMLVHALLHDPRFKDETVQAAYTKRHPQDHHIELTLTTRATDPLAEVERALREACVESLDLFEKQFFDDVDQ